MSITLYTWRRIVPNEMVNIESSHLRRPRSNMTPAEPSRHCRVCKKLFCCIECRETHEKRKHTPRELSCPLCKSQKLPLQIFEDKTLLCHIVISHLPLYCRLCGEVFKQSKDLESFGTCKWWTTGRRGSLPPDQKCVLGTPPLTLDDKDSGNEYNGKFCSLTSPPVLYRDTSTPVVFAQKNSFDYKTPSVPNFSFKTPKTDSASLKNCMRSASMNENSNSNYVSFSSSTDHKETPFRLLSSNRGSKDNPAKNNSRNIMKDPKQSNANVYVGDNNCVEDMELTSVEGEVLTDSQTSEVQPVKRRDSLKRVRFSDEYKQLPESNRTSTFNATENEEYFEACDTMSGMKDSFETAEIKIHKENEKNLEKENRSPEKPSTGQKASGTSRVVMMVVVENSSSVSASDLIDSGLKKLGHFVANSTMSTTTQISPGCASSVSSTSSFYSVSNHDFFSPSSQSNGSLRRGSNSSSNSTDSSSSGGIFSTVANAVKNVMKSFSGVGAFKSIETQQVSVVNEVVPIPSTSGTFNSASSSMSSPLRPGKRPRDAIESVPLTQKPTDVVAPQIEPRSPLAKRHRGWYKIKAREPIARMRNNHVTSPRGVSSETQVFHQGSLSVGDTVLPLPSRAHQSTQTDFN